MSNNFTFEKASLADKHCIFQWLDEPHVKEFWDNSLEYRADLVNYMEGRKTKSSYFDGIFSYFVGSINDEPFCLFMTSEVVPSADLPNEWVANLSKTGKTLSIDFMIGNTKYLGKGLAAPVLEKFTNFIKLAIDSDVDTFMIDPSKTNLKAQHVYEKAGFKVVAEFSQTEGFFENIEHLLMIKKLL